MAGPMPDIMPETAAQCLEALPQALLLVNGAGAVVHANPAAGALIEFDPAAVRGRQVHEIIPGYLPQKRLLHSSGLPDGQTGEAIMRTRSGRTIHVEVSQSMVGRGPKPLFCVVMHDITAHRRKLDNLAKGHEKMLAVANNMPILLEVFDEDNCMVFWNKEFERVTGYSLAQYGGDPKMMELIYPDPQYRRDVEVGIGGRGPRLPRPRVGAGLPGRHSAHHCLVQRIQAVSHSRLAFLGHRRGRNRAQTRRAPFSGKHRALCHGL